MNCFIKSVASQSTVETYKNRVGITIYYKWEIFLIQVMMFQMYPEVDNF